MAKSMGIGKSKDLGPLIQPTIGSERNTNRGMRGMRQGKEATNEEVPTWELPLWETRQSISKILEDSVKDLLQKYPSQGEIEMMSIYSSVWMEFRLGYRNHGR